MTARPPHTDLHLIGAIASGGVIGALGRYALGLALPHTPAEFPWATFTVNLSGAFAMGLLVAWLTDRPGAHRLVRPFVGVGILGGWTTFSALAVDAQGLIQAGAVGLALGYVVGTVVLGTLAIGLGQAIGTRIWPGP